VAEWLKAPLSKSGRLIASWVRIPPFPPAPDAHTRRGRLVVYGAALEMRFGGNPIEGSNPSLSATLSRTKRHHSVVRDGLLIDAAVASAYLETRY
jgi:hypothetical protein